MILKSGPGSVKLQRLEISCHTVDIKVDDLSPAKVTRIQVEKVRDRLLPEGSDGSVVDLSSIASIIFRFANDSPLEGGDSNLYGAFAVKRLFWVVLTVFCSERERPFFVPSPAIRFPQRAEGVKGPKR